jgi:micrococcal nuclease
MKKKTISALATLVTAAVILIGNVISDHGEKVLSDSLYTANRAVSERLTFPDKLLEAKKEGMVPFGCIEAAVTKVIDGDTFHISYNKKDYKVRMLDMNTPETVKSGVKPQPFAEEASQLTKETLTDKKVKLIFEKDTTDQFGRLLAHVILKDGTYYNAYMVENGYAICVFYSPNTLLKDYFKTLQDNAIEEKRGFWRLAEKDRPFVKDSKGKYMAAYKSKGKAA